ncbi:phenylacetate--CoA ligase family protein [Micromonospora sp. NPDC005367]|uniref:phenylacetate--CoA ligase family protein n=1 Tax=Micromonospora sp. NPDC005367 TaxID=3155590 RepID=UPI0033A2EE19
MSDSMMFEAVRDEIAYAFERTVFFREHMEANGLRPQDITDPEDFRRIPPTSKAHYRRNYPAGVLAKGYTLSSPEVMRFQSSGTSGERLNSAILSFDLARRQATGLGVNRRFDELWRPGGRPKICRYAPPNCSDVECATGFSTMQDRTLPDGTLVLTVAHDLLATPEWQIVQALDEIEEYQPDLLVVDPTHLAFLIRWARRLGRKITSSRRLHVVCGYTLMTDVARRQIEAFLGPNVPIGDMIGMSELGYLGFECHFGRRHINNIDFYPEFVWDGRPVEAGQIGELYVTTIDDALIPRIRYATGDYFTPLPTTCECGSELPVVRIEGRTTGMIRLQDGRLVTPGGVNALVGRAPWLDLYQLEQDPTGACTFRYIPNGEADSDAVTEGVAQIEARLADALAPNGVRLAATDYIASERSGKFQSCISTGG